MNSSNKTYRLITGLLVLNIVALLAFIIYILCTRPLHIFDEAVYANNVLHMAQHNEWLVYKDNGAINHFNTKPPLALYLQALCLKLFSYGEFSSRIPTLIALLAIILLFFHYTRKWKLNIAVAIIATYILLTTPGAIRTHVFLSGDLDGMLTLFLSLLIFNHLHQLQKRSLTSQSLRVMFIAFTLAFFTKSTAALLVIPSVAITYLSEGMLTKVLKKPIFYVYALTSLAVIASYYIIREKYDPGYFSLAFGSEGKRYFANVLDWHRETFWFYLQATVSKLNPVYTLLTAVLVVPFFTSGSSKNKPLVKNALLTCLIYLIIISIPQIKLEWYEAPIYPVWSFALAVMVYEVLRNVLEQSQKLVQRIAMLLALLVLPALQTVVFCKVVYTNQQYTEPEEKEGDFIKQLIHDQHVPTTLLINEEGRSPEQMEVLNYYVTALQQKHLAISIKRNVEDVKVNETLIVIDKPKLDSLNGRFYTTPLYKSAEGNYLRVNSLKMK